MYVDAYIRRGNSSRKTMKLLQFDDINLRHNRYPKAPTRNDTSFWLVLCVAVTTIYRITSSFTHDNNGILRNNQINTYKYWIVVVHGQESPFVTIPRFQNSVSTSSSSSVFRTNVCARQSDIDNGYAVLRSALRGLNLTVAIANYQVPTEDQLFSLSPEGTIKQNDPGLFVVLLDELARRSGFQWRNTYSAIDSGISENMTWTDSLLWQVHHFDISADYWGSNADRLARGVAFPRGWYDGQVVLVQSMTGRSEDEISWWSFLLPFDRNVWLAIVGAIIFTGLMYLLLERLDTDSDERELASRPWVSIFIASLTFTRHFEFRPKTNPARLLSFSWTFWSLIIASAYTANLVGFLVARHKSFNNVVVGTLEDALRHNTPVCVMRSSIMDEFVSRRYPDMVVVRKDTERAMFDALRLPWYQSNQGCGAVITLKGIYQTYKHNKEVNWDCSLRTENRVIRTLPTGFANAVDAGTYCTSLISTVLNLHMTEMINDGFVATAFQNHLQKLSTINCSLHADTTTDIGEDQYRLSMKDMAGIFIVHGCSMVVAVLYAAYHRWRKKKVM